MKPVGCSNLDCCGPSTWNATADELDAWCDESYTYETLSFGDSEFGSFSLFFSVPVSSLIFSFF